MVAFISYLENHQVDIVTVKLTYSHFITNCNFYIKRKHPTQNSDISSFSLTLIFQVIVIKYFLYNKLSYVRILIGSNL